MEGMHDELNRVVKQPKYQAIECASETLATQAEVWQDYFRRRDDSIITDIFEGQLCSDITCEKCGGKSLTFDTFMDLSIQLPN